MMEEASDVCNTQKRVRMGRGWTRRDYSDAQVPLFTISPSPLLYPVDNVTLATNIDNLFGVDPSEVHIHIQRVLPCEIPASKNEAANWLVGRFKLKDKLLILPLMDISPIKELKEIFRYPHASWNSSLVSRQASLST